MISEEQKKLRLKYLDFFKRISESRKCMKKTTKYMTHRLDFDLRDKSYIQ